MKNKTGMSQNGFSMLEIVIALAVLSILSVSGVIIYDKAIYQRTKVVATENAAQIVYNAAYAYLIDGNSKTLPQDAAKEYNEGELDTDDNTSIPAQTNLFASANIYNSFNTTEILLIGNELRQENNPPNPGNESSKQNIIVDVELLDEDRIKVVAEYSGTDIKAVRETPELGTAEEPERVEPPVKEEEKPSEEAAPIAPGKTLPDTLNKATTSRMTYQCSQERTGYLGVLNIADGTEVFWKEKENSDNTARYIPYIEKSNNLSISEKVLEQVQIFNHSEPLTLKAGVMYEVIVSGKFQVLSSPLNSETNDNLSDCLINSGAWGSESGLEYITYLSADKLSSVPSSIPNTVKSLRGAFIDADDFNSSDVVSWNTSKVSDMSDMFKNAKSFNQSIGSWNTGNVKDMSGMFEGASSFNKTIRKWDVKDVENMSSMFKNATSFNQEFNSWNSKSVVNLSSMFEGATSFNQKMSGFNTKNVTDMSRMFKNATSFNNQVNSWSVGNVRYMNEMFYNASSFNQKLKNWKVGNVIGHSDFSTGSKLSKNNMPQF